MSYIKEISPAKECEDCNYTIHTCEPESQSEPWDLSNTNF